MEVQETSIAGLLILAPKVFKDARGFFMETYRANLFTNLGLTDNFVQDNHSASSKGVVRGLHYQLSQPQGKLVRVTAGEVFDVAVDLRKNSATFGRHVAVNLSSENKRMFWIPPGFAHGFMVLSATAEIVYKCTDYYAPEHERTLLWNDPALGIEWPIEIESEPELSLKDRQGKTLANLEAY